MSTTKSGKLSAAKFKKNYKMAGEGAKAVRTILSAVEKRAGPQHSQGFDTLREAANEDKALTDECSHAIATAKQERAAGARRGADDLRLRKACDELSPQRLTALVEGGT